MNVFFFLYSSQAILQAADHLIFIVTEKQYKDGLEGSVPVLVQSVSHHFS